ncbi:Inosine/uridine-preferring nucleoside hydrolase domain-containing protein [Schizothecium vesticola]|uniref:Inosine/uridine-preferring nucleoside hydrolase domain-containing protein n=1 Tax=Schizothecium vesticola TaxID=314040 RepID=A0AA40FAD6_9PEZI|nr:Inosine/uridine-preferring nucleoside hydrolase domain-containing protein [Schizothecium vesticola]
MADTRIPVWLDCDPGHDDAFAILLACYHPRIRLLGISTVWGNASLDQTTPNALSILTALSKAHSIPVHPGASHALSRPPMHPPTDIHGATGLDGTDLLPAPVTTPSPIPAIPAMAAALLATPPNTAYLVATGAFTNAALLFASHPSLASHLAGVSLMGGAVGSGFTPAVLGAVDGVPRAGNWTQWAEFNVLADPEAADALFRNEALRGKITLVPLDLSHLVLGTEGVRIGILGGGTRLRRMLVELLMFFAGTYKEVFGIEEGPPLHDPLAVAAVLGAEGEGGVEFWDCDLATGERERFEVRVVTEGTYEDAKAGRTRTGQTVVRKLGKGEEGVRIPRGVDVEGFWRVMGECIERADEANEEAGNMV